MTFEEVLAVGVLIWEEDLLPYYQRVSVIDFKFD